jgi:hypothetical protein
MSSDAVYENFESRGNSEGGALEGYAWDAGVLNEPFDGIPGDFARDSNLLHRYTRLHSRIGFNHFCYTLLHIKNESMASRYKESKI